LITVNGRSPSEGRHYQPEAFLFRGALYRLGQK
jgi:hypothetical protein